MNQNIEPYRYMLEPGYIFFSKEPVLIMTVLGSCISVAIYDKIKKMGGMNHYRLPMPEKGSMPTANYGAPSISKLIDIMLKNGSRISDLKAQIFGGAQAANSSSPVGEENIKTAEKVLEKHNIKIVSRDTGGHLGRKVAFNTCTGEAIIAKMEDLRQSDWN